MKTIRYNGRDALADNNDFIFFYGALGWVDIADGVIIAHITRTTAKLATSKFTDIITTQNLEPQELEIKAGGLDAMLNYLEVPRTVLKQKATTTFRNRPGNSLISLTKMASSSR